MNNMLAHLQDSELSKSWLVGYWPGLPLCFGAGYLLMVFSSRQWMKDKAPIKPKIPLTAWNTGLAVFSIVALVQFALSALLSELRNGGFVHSVCLVKPFSTPTLTLCSSYRKLWNLAILSSSPYERLPSCFSTSGTT